MRSIGDVPTDGGSAGGSGEAACDPNGQVTSALPGLFPGTFAAISYAKNQGWAVDKPVIRARINRQGSGIGLLALGAWILSNIDDAQAQPAFFPGVDEPVDWDFIGPQDLAFGKIIVTTFDGQVAFLDNPFAKLVVKMLGTTASVQTVQLSQTQVAQLLQESRIVFGNFSVNLQQQANLTNPTATGAPGSSTDGGPFLFNSPVPITVTSGPTGPTGGPSTGPTGTGG